MSGRCSHMQWVPCVVLVVALAAPGAVLAVAETAAPVLSFSLTPRSEAMGMSGVADRSDPGNVYFNPANAACTDGMWFNGARVELVPDLASDVWFGDINVGGGYTFHALRDVRFAFNLTMARIDYGESIATTPEGTPIGTYDSHEDVLGLTFAASGSAGPATWALGLAAKRLAIDYAPSEITVEGDAGKASSWITDVGAVIGTDIDASDWTVYPSAGVAAVNMGSDIDFGDGRRDPLPTWLNYGVSVRIDSPDVRFGSNSIPAFSATMNVEGKRGLNDQRPFRAFGYELALLDVIFARWGRHIDDEEFVSFDTWGVGLGAPVGPVRARVEYSETDSPYSYAPQNRYGLSLIWLFDRGQG